MISSNDRTILRDLARQVANIADLPIQQERRELWKRHNSRELYLFLEATPIAPGGRFRRGDDPRLCAPHHRGDTETRLRVGDNPKGHTHLRKPSRAV